MKYTVLFKIMSIVISLTILSGWVVGADGIEELTSKAKSYQSAGRYQEAIEVYDQILAISPDNPDIILEKMEILWKIGEYYEANLLDERLDTIRQNNPEPCIYFYWRSGGSRMCADYMNRGIDLMIKNRFDEALFHFDLVRQYCPDDPNMVNMLCDEANCLYKQGNYEMAIAKYDEAIERSNTLLIENPGDKIILTNKKFAEIDREKIINKIDSFTNATPELTVITTQSTDDRSIIHTNASNTLPAYEESPATTKGAASLVTIVVSIVATITCFGLIKREM